MHTELKILIILLPFAAVLISSIFFIIFQMLLNKSYLFNLIISFFIVLFLILIQILKINFFITIKEIFYIIFSFTCSFYLFTCLIQSQISSIQLTLLRIIDTFTKINKKKILKIYNVNNMFEERIKRLELSGLIEKKKSSYFIKNKKIIIYLNFTKLLRNIFINKK